MAQHYHHLQCDERYQIRGLQEKGVLHPVTARQLGRSKSTNRREIKHNSGPSGYRHKQAQRMAEARRSKADASSRPYKLTPSSVWGIVCAFW